MAERTRSLIGDGLLAGMCIIGVALAATALWQPATGRGETLGAGPALATVTSVASAVRLRPANTLVWNQVAPSDPAFESDTLFVPADGSASLRFGDGTELRLDPSTLIVLERPAADDARPAIELREGGLVGESGATGLEIRSQSGAVTLAGESQVQVARTEEGTQVHVLEGRANLDTAAGARSVSASEVGGFDDSGALRENERLPITLLAPAPQGVVDVASDETVVFRWRGAEGEHRYTLQVARDSGFSDRVLEIRLPPQTAEHSFEVASPGAHWWRLVDDSDNPVSPTSSFHARATAPPVLIFPQMNQVVLAPPDRGLVFTWSVVDGCSAYRTEVARDEEFSTVVLSEAVEGPQLWVGHGLDEGHYYWRVRAENCGNVPFSASSRFRLISKPLLDAPATMDAEVVEH